MHQFCVPPASLHLKDIDRDMDLRPLPLLLSYMPQVLGSLFLADPKKSAISPPLRAILGMYSLDRNRFAKL